MALPADKKRLVLEKGTCMRTNSYINNEPLGPHNRESLNDGRANSPTGSTTIPLKKEKLKCSRKGHKLVMTNFYKDLHRPQKNITRQTYDFQREKVGQGVSNYIILMKINQPIQELFTIKYNQLTNAENKEIKRTASGRVESTEHEREQEMDIKSNIITQTTDYQEETEIYTTPSEDNAESLERRDLRCSQACNKTSPKDIGPNYCTEKIIFRKPRMKP